MAQLTRLCVAFWLMAAALAQPVAAASEPQDVLQGFYGEGPVNDRRQPGKAPAFAKYAPVLHIFKQARQSYRAGPTVSAIRAPRRPSGFGCPTVLSRAVWCSISAFSLAPTRMTTIDIHIQVIKPITAPSEP
jgi:hypothetical protein